MSGKNQGYIASGAYAGSQIKEISYGYMGVYHYNTDNLNFIINNQTCRSVEIINKATRDTSDAALKGAFLAGTAGAIVGASSNSTEYLVKITWSNGSTSLVKCNGTLFNSIYVSSTKATNQSVNTGLKKQAEKEANSNLFWQIMGAIVAGIVISYYILTN